MNRRHFLSVTVSAFAGVQLSSAQEQSAPFRLRYLLASSLYGNLPLAQVLPEVKKTGAEAIDLWPKVHGTQREEMDALGHPRFAAMLQEAGVRLGGLTRFDRGAFRLDDEIQVAAQFGCPLIVTGSSGNPDKLTGEPLKQAVAAFAEKLKPIGARAAESGVTIAIENHVRALIESPDSLRWLADFAPPGIGVAFAPYHLPSEPDLLASLLRDLGPKLTLFYAWEHGRGSTGQLTVEEQVQQLPGCGTLDFRPLLRALREIGFTGPTEIFMHPTPRGIPIRPTAGETTAELNKARAHLEQLLATL